VQHLVTPYTKQIEPFAWWEGAFTEEQLNWLQNKAKEANVEAQVGGSSGVTDQKIRRAKLNWLTNNEENIWVFNILSHVVSNINASYYNFNLVGFGEELQLVHYHSDNQGTYHWHQDFGEGISRKLSLVLQLSDPNEYEGGELQLLNNKNPTSIKKQRGHITIFPAWTLHQVTPVIKGSRQSLVAWVSGEPFR